VSQRVVVTNPSSLLGNPLGDVLGEDEADDKADDVGEEPANAALDYRHRDTITEAQQRQHSAPCNASVTE